MYNTFRAVTQALLPYLKYWKPATFAALILLTWASITYGKHQAYERGLSDAKNAQLVQAFKAFTKTADSLSRKSAHQDTVIVEKVHVLATSKATYRHLVDTVKVLSVDSAALLAVEHAAETQQAASDSVSAAKDVLIGTLHAEVSVRDSLLAVSHAQLKLALNQKPSRFARVVTAAKWAGIGAGVYAIVKR